MKQLFLFCLVFFFQMSFAEECSKEFLLTYFPESFVNQTLSKFHVPKDEWAAINQELKAKDDEVIQIVEEKAAKMNPNPLLDPTHRQAAVKLFRDTLFQVFSDVLYAHGIKDQKKVQDMLDDIQHQRAEQFAECVKNQDAKGYQPSKEDNFEYED